MRSSKTATNKIVISGDALDHPLARLEFVICIVRVFPFQGSRVKKNFAMVTFPIRISFKATTDQRCFDVTRIKTACGFAVF